MNLELVEVKFLMKRPPYTIGESAGFLPHIAKRLVDGKIASYSKANKENAEKILKERKELKKDKVMSPKKVGLDYQTK